MENKDQPKPQWSRPAVISRIYGIPRGSLYRVLKDNPEIRTASLRGPGSARLINVEDIEAFLEKMVSQTKLEEAK